MRVISDRLVYSQLTDRSSLSDEAPVRDEGPVNKQSPADQIFFRHRSPPAAVKTIIAVVAHREIAACRHLVCFGRIGQYGTRLVSAIPVFGAHDAFKAITFDNLSVHVELRRLYPQDISGRTG